MAESAFHRSPPSIIIASLRKSILTGSYGSHPNVKHYRDTLVPKQNLISECHLFDFEELDQNYQPSDRQSLLDEAKRLQKTIGLFLPHEKVAYLARYSDANLKKWAINVFLCFQRETDIVTHCFIQTESHSWVWTGQGEIQRFDKQIKFLQDNVNKDLIRLVSTPIYCSMILLLKKDTIILEPSPWRYITPEGKKPKAFETPHPTTTIVKVNTHRIIRPEHPAGPTGAKFTPRHVRAYPKRVGNRETIVPAHVSPRNSKPERKIKIVKLEK